MKMEFPRFQNTFLSFFLLCLCSVINSGGFVQCSHHPYFTNSSAVLSLPLYPPKQPNHNHTAFELSLLSDMARIKSINSKIQRAVRRNYTAADDELFRPSTPLFYGAGGAYLVRIGVGHLEHQAYLIADTGSPLVWLQCQPCVRCFNQFGPIFDPSKSSSFAPLRCSSGKCNLLLHNRLKQCRSYSEQCGYKVSYGDGTYSAGYFATETLTFAPTPVKGVAIGCSVDGSGRGDYGFAYAAGILGLGPQPESFPSQIKASSFSYCLVDSYSNTYSSLEFNSAPPRDSIIVPMLSNPVLDTGGFYYVGLAGITVQGALLPIPPSVFKIQENGDGGVFLDSGTTLTLLTTQAFQVLQNAILKRTRGIPTAPGITGITCYKITSANQLNRFPEVGFVLSGGAGTLRVKNFNYLRPIHAKSSKFCLYFGDSGGGISVIGMTQQQGYRVTYDLVNRRIGFSPNKC